MTLKPDEERGSRFSLGGAVVNLTGTGHASREMRWPTAGLTTHLEFVERNLERESAAEVLGGMEAGRWSRCLLPWVALMSGGDDPMLVDRWKRLAEAEPDSHRRADYGGLAQVFADHVGRKVLWHEKLKGWNMTESSVVNARIAEGEAKGRTEGEAKGRTEGRAEGEAKGSRAFLARIGAKKFGHNPTVEQRNALDAITDPVVLTRLGERVLDVGSWDELPQGS